MDEYPNYKFTKEKDIIPFGKHKGQTIYSTSSGHTKAQYLVAYISLQSQANATAQSDFVVRLGAVQL